MGERRYWRDYPNPRREWDKHRARPGEEKTVTFERGKGDDAQIFEVTFVTGECPCAECGHTEQWQCDDADCECCSELCT